jgi:hypothetical protein
LKTGFAPVPDADATLQAANANAISASDVFKTLGVRPWYIVTSFKTQLGSEGVDARRGAKSPRTLDAVHHHLAVPLPFQIILQ